MSLNVTTMPNEPSRFRPDDLNEILSHALTYDVSDITIQTNQSVCFEIFGRLYSATKRRLSNTEVGDLLNHIYGANGTTHLLSGQDLDTNYEFRPDRVSRHRYRVNATACTIDGHHGIQITLRTIPCDPPTIDTMMLPESIIQAMAPSDGCVYVTGATGSGKSTLLSSMIRHIAEQPDCNRKILTYESPIEFVYDNIQTPTAIISQSEIPKHLPSFAHGVRNALRRKPRLILVGESRDLETINACLSAALTGHPVYTTVHANGVAETVRRLVGGFPKEERQGKSIDLIETMRLIIWQRLVPTVDGKRTPLREYLIFTDEIRDELLACDFRSITENTRKIVRRLKQTMYDDAVRKHKEGIIEQSIVEQCKRHHMSQEDT